jgi:hypothetical protein
MPPNAPPIITAKGIEGYSHHDNPWCCDVKYTCDQKFLQILMLYWNNRREMHVLIHVYFCRRIFLGKAPMTLERCLVCMKNKFWLASHPDKQAEKPDFIKLKALDAATDARNELDALIYEAQQHRLADQLLSPEPERCPVSRAIGEPITPWTTGDRVEPEQEIMSLLQRHGYQPRPAPSSVQTKAPPADAFPYLPMAPPGPQIPGRQARPWHSTPAPPAYGSPGTPTTFKFAGQLLFRLIYSRTCLA